MLTFQAKIMIDFDGRVVVINVSVFWVLFGYWSEPFWVYLKHLRADDTSGLLDRYRWGLLMNTINVRFRFENYPWWWFCVLKSKSGLWFQLQLAIVPFWFITGTQVSLTSDRPTRNRTRQIGSVTTVVCRWHSGLWFNIHNYRMLTGMFLDFIRKTRWCRMENSTTKTLQDAPSAPKSDTYYDRSRLFANCKYVYISYDKNTDIECTPVIHSSKF